MGCLRFEIDTLVRQFMARGESLYSVDGGILRVKSGSGGHPDLSPCVPASPEDLAAVIRDFEKPPEVLCLNPQNLSDVWRDVMLVAQATSRVAVAEDVIREIHDRLRRFSGSSKQRRAASRGLSRMARAVLRGRALGPRDGCAGRR